MGVKHIILAVSYRAELLVQELKALESKVRQTSPVGQADLRYSIDWPKLEPLLSKHQRRLTNHIALVLMIIFKTGHGIHVNQSSSRSIFCFA